MVHVCALLEPVSHSESVLPAPLAALREDFGTIFESPSTLPLERDCDHAIPLITGARPVHIRPYRYPPALKDEIELQVAEMLRKGIIQPSVSPFSSPILLVKKKDGS